MRKHLLTGFAAAAALFASPAMAAETLFAGYTDGCFNCAPAANSGASSISLGGLTYTDSTFSAGTAGGFLGLGAAPGSPNIDNLGSFTLSGTPFTYTGNMFNLLVTFTAPAGTAPGSTLFTAPITGTVLSADNGGVLVDFDNTARNFTFSGGSFTFSVNDVSLTAGRNAPVTGTIIATNSAVPEPATWAMMLTGFGFVGFSLRRRRNDTKRVRFANA